jgi:hypothetical protein
VRNETLTQILEQCPIVYREQIEADVATFARTLDPGADPVEIDARTVEHACALVERAKVAYETRVRQSFGIFEYIEKLNRRDGEEHFQELSQNVKAVANSAKRQRETFWQQKQKDIVHHNNVLLINIEHPSGTVIWKIPAADVEFVKNVLPVFAKRLEDLELPEAAELRKLQKSLRVNRWRMTPASRGDLEKQIEDAKACLERAKNRTPIPRFGIYKTIDGRDVGVHRLYLGCDEDEQVSAFDGDLTNYCTVKARCRVRRNFGFTEKQVEEEVPKKIARQYEDRLLSNLYVVSSDRNPSHERMQADFESKSPVISLNDHVENWKPPISPNADLGAHAMCWGKIQDAGKFKRVTAAEIAQGGIDCIGYIERPVTEDVDQLLFEPKKPAPKSARLQRAGKILDLLLGSQE